MKQLRKIIGLVSGILPLGIASLLGMLLFIGIPIFHGSEFYFLPTLMKEYIWAALIYVLFVFMVWKIIVKLTSKLQYIYLYTIVFLIALLSRILVLLLFKDQIHPFSDFQWSWDVAQGYRGYGFFRHLPFPAYHVWAFFERLITVLSPGSYFTVLVSNAIIDSFTAACILIVLRNAGLEKTTSLLGGLLYSLFPSAIIYCTVGTPEFLAILFNMIGIIFLTKRPYDRVDRKVQWLYLGIAGIAFGLSSSFKSFSIVIIFAYCMIRMLFRNDNDKGGRLQIVIEGLVLVIIFLLVKRVVMIIISSWLNTDMTKYSSGAIYHQLMVGLNTEGEGQIHLGTLSRVFLDNFMSNGYNSIEAATCAKTELINDWKINLSRIPDLFIKKIIWAWQDDLIPIQYFLSLEQINGDIHNGIYGAIRDAGPIVSQVYYIFLCFTGLIASIIGHRSDVQNRNWMLIKMTIFGFFLLLLVIEAQSRYKCLIIPFICMLAAKGTVNLFSTRSSHRLSRNHMKNKQ